MRLPWYWVRQTCNERRAKKFDDDGINANDIFERLSKGQ